MAQLLNDLLDQNGSFRNEEDSDEVVRVSEEIWGPPIKKFKGRSCNFPSLNLNPNISAFVKGGNVVAMDNSTMYGCA